MAAFEMFELGESTRQLPDLPQVKPIASANTGPVLPIPPEIRPTLVKYRYPLSTYENVPILVSEV